MLTSGLVENIGTDVPQPRSRIRHHVQKLEPVLAGRGLQAVGHRVVQGCRSSPPPCSPRKLSSRSTTSPRWHRCTTRTAQGMRAAMHKWPPLPQVAIFDTAFHSTMPEEAWRYAIPLRPG